MDTLTSTAHKVFPALRNRYQQSLPPEDWISVSLVREAILLCSYWIRFSEPRIKAVFTAGTRWNPTAHHGSGIKSWSDYISWLMSVPGSQLTARNRPPKHIYNFTLRHNHKKVSNWTRTRVQIDKKQSPCPKLCVVPAGPLIRIISTHTSWCMHGSAPMPSQLSRRRVNQNAWKRVHGYCISEGGKFLLPMLTTHLNHTFRHQIYKSTLYKEDDQ
jgi:hypothetical protein